MKTLFQFSDTRSSARLIYQNFGHFDGRRPPHAKKGEVVIGKGENSLEDAITAMHIQKGKKNVNTAATETPEKVEQVLEV